MISPAIYYRLVHGPSPLGPSSQGLLHVWGTVNYGFFLPHNVPLVHFPEMGTCGLELIPFHDIPQQDPG